MAERNISAYTRPRYIESAYSATVYVGVLKTPTLTMNGTSTTTTGLLSWGNIDANSSYYELWVSYNSGAYVLYDDNIFYPTSTYQLPNTLADGTYKFKVRATVVITDPDTSVTATYHSAFSNETFEFTVDTLGTPVLQSIQGTSKYYWDPITDAETYTMTITKDNGITNTVNFLQNEVPTSNDPYILDYNVAGTYTISVIAYHSNPFLFHNSLSSTASVYSVIKLDTPVLPESGFTADPPTITWSAITYATGYNIFLNNNQVATNYAITTYDFTNDISSLVDAYDFSAKITAIVYGQVEHPNPKYLESEYSNTITWGLLPDPVIHMNTTPGTDNRVIIDNYNALNNAQFLEIYDGNDLIDTVLVGEYYDLTSNTPKIFNIRIKAVSNDPHMTDSNYSNLVSYQILKLATPILQDSSSADATTATLSWNSVINADKYEIYLNSELVATSVDNYYNLPLITGQNRIYIVATSQYYRYLNSDISNIVSKAKDPTSQYQVKINNVNYDAALPFVFNETLDETMDTASISTVPLTISKPFEAYEEVDIIVSNPDETGGDTYKIIPGFPKHMILSQDEVEEISIGTSSKYIHHLNLIERTKLLETELMPDFSITQPLEYAMAVNTAETVLLSPKDNSQAVFSDSSPKQLMVYNIKSNGGYGYSGYSIYCHGLSGRGLMGNLYSKYSKSDTISLPYERATEFNITGTHAYINWIGAGHYDRRYEQKYDSIAYTSKDLGISVYKRYKYRTHSDSYNVDNEHPETTIGTYTDGIQHNWNISAVPVGHYDIILEVYITDDGYNTLKNKFNYAGGYQNSTKLNFMYNGSSIPASGTTSNSGFWNNLKLYRIVWSDILITSAYEYDDSNIIPFESKSIKDAIDKALHIVKPLGVSRYTTPKYTLDPKFNYLGNYTEEPDDNGNKKKVNYYPCPELKFQNQKSLYEVLLEIGRLFYGIPRLGAYDTNNIWQPNMITFDILDQSTIDAANTTDFTDQDTLETVKSTIDNHNTGFVSDLSNIVTIDYFSIFPAGNLWTTPRSGSDEDPMANKDNMAIVLDRPIYRLVDVFVKNFDPADPERYVSIKNFINEASIYQSLNNDAEGKGLSLFYSQGSNKIEGLGQIPQNSQIQAALGLTSSDYIISIIVEYASGDVSRQTVNGRANNLQYKVLYVPFVDSKIYTEQANVSGLKNQNYKALNQENNIITDKSFGQSAQTQVERLGNNTIEKSYISNDLNEMPKLGTIKEFDGYKYYVDTITYRFNNRGFEGTASYSKNFNKINERVGIDAMYRLYRIYADDFIDRSININRYCYLSKSLYTDVSRGTMSNTNYKLVKDIKAALGGSSNALITAPVIKPDSLYVRPMKSDSTRLQYNTFDGSLANVSALMLPVNYNIYGNSISFTAEMKDNFSAGITTAKYNNSTGSYVPDVYNGQRIQHDARYVDTNGELGILGLTIFRYNDNSTLGVSADMYPLANYITSNINVLNGAIYSEKINVNKDNRERIKLNYQLHFLTFDKNLTIHPGLTSRLYRNDRTYTTVQEAINIPTPVYVLFKNDISKMSNIGNTTRSSEARPTFTQSRSIITIGTATITADRSYDGYALIWPSTGEIIYSYRTPIGVGSFTIPRLYLNFSDNKVSYKNS